MCVRNRSYSKLNIFLLNQQCFFKQLFVWMSIAVETHSSQSTSIVCELEIIKIEKQRKKCGPLYLSLPLALLLSPSFVISHLFWTVQSLPPYSACSRVIILSHARYLNPLSRHRIARYSSLTILFVLAHPFYNGIMHSFHIDGLQPALFRIVQTSYSFTIPSTILTK